MLDPAVTCSRRRLLGAALQGAEPRWGLHPLGITHVRDGGCPDLLRMQR